MVTKITIPKSIEVAFNCNEKKVQKGNAVCYILPSFLPVNLAIWLLFFKCQVFCTKYVTFEKYFLPLPIAQTGIMKVTEKIETSISKMPDGTAFKYEDLAIAPDEYPAAAKAIERLIKKGLIYRASTGVFYKPKKTAFGNLKPKEDELLKPYLFENGKRIAYVTGTSLYNRMGLTTQVPKNIRVASRSKRIVTKIGSIQVKPVKSYVDVTSHNYYLMELLDVLKDFKIIPDTEKNQVIKFMLQKIKGLTNKEKKELVEIALKYPPRVRAFAGAILNEINPAKPEAELRKSINPLTSYAFGINKKLLSNIEYWNIR
jgi:hypothetical protein